MIVTSNKPFSAWGEIFGDDMAATAMIDRLIHHSEIVSLKGDSYRLRGKDLDARIASKTRASSPETGEDPWPRRTSGYELRSALRAFAPLAAAYLSTLTGWSTFRPAPVVHISTGLDTAWPQRPARRVSDRAEAATATPRSLHERGGVCEACSVWRWWWCFWRRAGK